MSFNFSRECSIILIGRLRLTFERTKTGNSERIAITVRDAVSGVVIDDTALSPLARYGLPDMDTLLELLGYSESIEEDVRLADLKQALDDGAGGRSRDLSRSVAGTRIPKQELTQLAEDADRNSNRMLYFGIAEYTRGTSGIEPSNYRYVLRIGEEGHFELIALCEGLG